MRPVGNASGLVLATLVACAGFAVHAEVRPGETQGLGLRGADTPKFLKAVAADPYRAPAEPACQTIPAELKALDEVLGADADEPRKHKSQVVKWAMGSVRGMVPYRGVVRFLTQADQHDHALMDATMAGFARRGFLRGLEANLHCAGEATPVSAPSLDVPPPALDAPTPVVASVTPAQIPHLGIPVAYAQAEPGGPPAASRDLATLMLSGTATAAPPDDAAPDPGR